MHSGPGPSLWGRGRWGVPSPQQEGAALGTGDAVALQSQMRWGREEGSEKGPEGAVGTDQPLGCLLTPLSERLRTDLGVCIWTLFPVFLDFLAVDLRRLPEVSISSPRLPAECCPAAPPPWPLPVHAGGRLY